MFEFDPTMCRGKDADGSQCICMRCTETHIVDNRALCVSCGHIESGHPVPELPRPKVGSFIRGFQDAGRLGITPGSVKTSRADAEAETNAGLRKKRKSDTDTEPPSQPVKKAKSKEKEKSSSKPPKTEKSQGEQVCFGEWVFLTSGVANGVLRQSKVPNLQQRDIMRKAGLVVLSTPQNPLFVNTAWSCERLNREVKKVFPKVIRYLEARPFAGDPDTPEDVKGQLWLGVFKQKHSLLVASDAFPTGVELADHCKGPNGRKQSERVLYIASKLPISKERFTNWDAPDTEPDSEDLGSDINTLPSEDIIWSPRKPAQKVKEEPQTDMKHAAHMRTRIGTGMRKRKPTIFIPGSDDEENPAILETGSSASDVLEISDDEFPTTEALFEEITAPSAIVQTFTSPLLTNNSPPRNTDPPSFYDDFDYGPQSFGPHYGLLPIPAVVQSSTASSSSTPNLDTPTWNVASIIGAVGATSPDASIAERSESSGAGEILPAPVVLQRPRFSVMGKGRIGRNPWTTK